jgi:hypothetical protein
MSPRALATVESASVATLRASVGAGSRRLEVGAGIARVRVRSGESTGGRATLSTTASALACAVARIRHTSMPIAAR